MKEQKKRYLGFGLLAVFALWTVLLRFVDVRAIGPQNSSVGFAALNGWFRDLVGVHLSLYTLTDWLSLVPLGIALGFACLGLGQWIKRGSLQKVDTSILILGGFYLVVMAVYVLFEYVPINYRPVLLEGVLEVSYPSSTTMLVLCIMPTAILQLSARIGNRTCRRFIIYLLLAFTVFMVAGRVISGVHWLSDIIGGALLSSGLVLIYDSLT